MSATEEMPVAIQALETIAAEYGARSAVCEALLDVRLYAEMNGVDFPVALRDSCELYLETREVSHADPR